MNQIWTTLAWIAIVTAVTVVALPLAAIMLISLASVREEAAHSLSGQPPGWIERTARRLLSYHADPAAMKAAKHMAGLTDLPPAILAAPRAGARRSRRGPARPDKPSADQAGGRGAEVRFAHARRTLPDPGQQPASRELGASADGAWHRQGAGV